jgi:Na+/proline symporter
VADNKGGSYMTMFSKGGLIFGVINIIGNFGTVSRGRRVPRSQPRLATALSCVALCCSLVWEA